MNRRDFLKLSAATAAAAVAPLAAAKALAPAPLIAGELGVVEGFTFIEKPRMHITRWVLTAHRDMQQFFAIGGAGALRTELEWTQEIFQPGDEKALPCVDDIVTLSQFKESGVGVPDNFPDTKYRVADVRLEINGPHCLITARVRAFEVI